MIIKWEIMNYENFALFLKAYVGGDNKLWINLVWPNGLMFIACAV